MKIMSVIVNYGQDKTATYDSAAGFNQGFHETMEAVSQHHPSWTSVVITIVSAKPKHEEPLP